MCVAVCCNVLQCVAVSCSELQCVAVCCSMLQCVAADFRECLVIFNFENAISMILFIMIAFRVCHSVL